MSQQFYQLLREREEISIRYEKETQSIWCYFNPKVRPCYTMKMMQEMHHAQLEIIDYFKSNHMKPKIPIRYLIVASQSPGVYSYGGDLNFFSELIRQNDKDSLLAYAKASVDVVYHHAVNLNLPITTISLVEGNALGGGFESALSSDIIIAEEHVKMGFPEIRFNLFPGMGAYNLLARKVGTSAAEKMLTSGTIYDAKTLYDKNLISILAKQGHAKEALGQFLQKYDKVFNGMQAIQTTKHISESLDYTKLLQIVELWVDAALQLTPKDLKMMHKITKSQLSQIDEMQHSLRTRQDRRIDLQNVHFPFTDYNGNTIYQERRSGSERRLCG